MDITARKMTFRSGPVTSTDPEYCIRDIEFTLAQMKVHMDGRKLEHDAKISAPNVACVQMRHLATDLAFLCGLDMTDVIYIATNPMHHLLTLASLFPQTTFHIYHPSSVGLGKAPNITYKGAVFDTDAVAEWTKFCELNDKVAMISDARVSKISGEAEVRLTMETQSKWFRAVKPMYWTMTFRVPASLIVQKRNFFYLDGNLFYVPYTRGLTPELTLAGNYQHLVSPPVEYKAHVIQELLFYHNIIVRPNGKLFANVLHSPPSMEKYSDSAFDNGFDTSYFLISLLWYTWRKDAIAHPVGEANILAFAKRLMGSLFW